MSDILSSQPGVASINFKICIAVLCFRVWKVFIAFYLKFDQSVHLT